MTDVEQVPLVVQRWKRYGHDRAYVRRGEQELGYRDLQTGNVHETVTGCAAAIIGATDGLLHPAALYVARHAEPDEQRPRPRPAQAPLGPDRDLELNLPGSAAGAKAIELRDAAPVRTLFDRVAGKKTDERAFRIGAKAEREVARRLDGLGPGWHILHAVPVGERGSDIDHVVIGPGGVFTINTKHHPDATVWIRGETVKVNGYNEPYVRKSRHEARRAAGLLTARAGFDVDVRAVIAVMGAKTFTVASQPTDGIVSVVTRRELARYLSALPPVLGTPSVERIYSVARHLATWQPTKVAWSDF